MQNMATKVKDLMSVDDAIEEMVASPRRKTIGIVEALKSDEKKGDDYFDCNASVVTYKTGIPQLDYYLGYRINVYNDNDDVIDTYPSIGITGGSMVTFIGKPSTAKTTTAAQIAANIVRPFENGFIVHFDLNKIGPLLSN